MSKVSLYRGMTIDEFDPDEFVAALSSDDKLKLFVIGQLDSIMRGERSQFAISSSESGGVGIHWSTDRSVSESFALKFGKSLRIELFNGAIPLVISATAEAGDALDPSEIGFYGWNGKDEKEVGLKPGSTIQINSVSVLVPTDRKSFISEYDESGKASTKSVEWFVVNTSIRSSASLSKEAGRYDVWRGLAVENVPESIIKNRDTRRLIKFIQKGNHFHWTWDKWTAERFADSYVPDRNAVRVILQGTYTAGNYAPMDLSREKGSLAYHGDPEKEISLPPGEEVTLTKIKVRWPGMDRWSIIDWEPLNKIKFYSSTSAGSKTASKWDSFSLDDLSFEFRERSSWAGRTLEVLAFAKATSHLPVGRMQINESNEDGDVPRLHVSNVGVVESVRRRGVATAMLEQARRKFGPVSFYDSDYTEDGAAWAKSLGQSATADSQWGSHGVEFWISRGASMSREAVRSTVPLPVGETPIPPGTFRAYHWTSSQNMSSILSNGLKMQNARGGGYGEPTAIWFSGRASDWGNPELFDDGKILVEVALPNDTYIANGGKDATFAITSDVPPSAIVAIHEAWHGGYRYLSEYRDQVLAGEWDHAMDLDQYRRGIEQIKREGGLTVSASQGFRVAKGLALTLDGVAEMWREDLSMEITDSAARLVNVPGWSGVSDYYADAAMILMDAARTGRMWGTLYSGHVRPHADFRVGQTWSAPLLATTRQRGVAERFANPYPDPLNIPTLYVINGAPGFSVDGSDFEIVVSGSFRVTSVDPGEITVVTMDYIGGLSATAAVASSAGKPIGEMSESEFRSLEPRLLYHAASYDRDLQTLLNEGVKMSNVPMTMARRRYQSGEYAEYSPGNGVGMGLYATQLFNTAVGFGRYIIAIEVNPGDYELPPESSDPLYKMEWALRDANGVLITKDIPASRVHLVTDFHRYESNDAYKAATDPRNGKSPSKTASASQGFRVARGLVLELDGDQGLKTARKVLDGTVTAKDIVDTLGGRAGEWWGDIDLDWSVDAARSFAECEEFPSEYWIENEIGGEIGVVLVGVSPVSPGAHNEPGNNNQDLPRGTSVQLTEVHYYHDDMWRVLPVSGLSVSSSVHFDTKLWPATLSGYKAHTYSETVSEVHQCYKDAAKTAARGGYPKAPLSGAYDTARQHEHWHYSSTGQVPGPIVHVGDRKQAEDRARSLHNFSQTYTMDDFVKGAPVEHFFVNRGNDGFFAVRLKARPGNAGSPVSDAEVNSMTEAEVRRYGGVVEYTNAFEGYARSRSYACTLDNVEIVGFSRGDFPNVFFFDSSYPMSQAGAVAQKMNQWAKDLREFWSNLDEDEEEEEDDEDEGWGAWGSKKATARTASGQSSPGAQEIMDLAVEVGVGDVFKTIHNVALGHQELSAVNDDLDLDTVRLRDVQDASALIKARSQRILRERGYGPKLKVYRSEIKPDSGLSMSSNDHVVSCSLRPTSTFGEQTSFDVDLTDVLTYVDGLIPWGTFAEGEVQVDRKLMSKTASLDNEARISVAENVMERSGYDGKSWLIKNGHVDDPAYNATMEPIRQFVAEVVGERVRVHAAGDYTMNYEMHGAQAMVTRTGTMFLRPGIVTELTVLHECAHIINNSTHGQGHDDHFIRIAADLYGKYIGPKARETFLDLAVPFTSEASASAGYVKRREGYTSDGVEFRIYSHMLDPHTEVGLLRVVRVVDDIWQITAVEVREHYQRQGIASNLLRTAREELGTVIHDDTLSGDAKAWKAVVGASGRNMERTSSSQVRQLGPSRLTYDYFGQVQRIGIVDSSSAPSKPGWTYFTEEPVEEYYSRKRREDWDAGNGTTKRKPDPKYKEGTGTADKGTVAFLDYIERSDEIFIAYMAVRDDYRRRGMAKRLVDWIYDRARKTGKSQVNWGEVFYPANQMYWDYHDRDMGVQTIGRPLDRRMGAIRQSVNANLGYGGDVILDRFMREIHPFSVQIEQAVVVGETWGNRPAVKKLVAQQLGIPQKKVSFLDVPDVGARAVIESRGMKKPGIAIVYGEALARARSELGLRARSSKNLSLTSAKQWTSYPELNEVIDAYLDKIGNRLPADVHGLCEDVAEDFAEFAKERGVDIRVTHTNLDEMGYKVTGKPHGEILDDDGNIVMGHYYEHTVNEFYPPDRGWPIVIDFTALQYGYTDQVKIS